MSTENIVGIFLPLSLAIIMLGFGLSLVPDDFKRVARYPRAVMVGLFCQMILLPLLGIGLCYAFQLPPTVSIGLMILAASPGGIAANIFSHLSHGDVALNLTLTAINCVLAAFTLPLIVNLSISHFGGSEAIGLQFKKTIEVFLIVLIPVMIGMIARKKFPDFSNKADRPVRIFSVVVLAVITLLAILKERNSLLESMAQIGVAMFLFNLGSMGLGFGVSKLFKLKTKEATAITMEVGIHNSTLALYIAMTLLGSFELALPAAIYSIFMFMTATLFSFYLVRVNKREPS